MNQVDLLVTNIGELVTPPASAGALHGRTMCEVVRVPDAALAVKDGRIAAAGARQMVENQYEMVASVDAGGRCVVPGFVDPHTHAVWAGEHAGEFEQRIAGATYMQIMAAGGGILSTVRATRDPRSEAVARCRIGVMVRLVHSPDRSSTMP